MSDCVPTCSDVSKKDQRAVSFFLYKECKTGRLLCVTVSAYCWLERLAGGDQSAVTGRHRPWILTVCVPDGPDTVVGRGPVKVQTNQSSTAIDGGICVGSRNGCFYQETEGIFEV